MNAPKRFQSLRTAGLVCTALLTCVSAASAQTLTVLGGSPPTPGTGDQYQLAMPSGANQPPGLNYYFDNGNAPGQLFTTGSHPGGYVLSSVALYDAGNNGGGFTAAQTFTLYLYAVSGDTASLLTSYTSQSLSIPDLNWIQWTNLGAILQPNTQYAFAMHRNGSGWANMGNVAGDKYAAGQVASIPTGGGTMIFSTAAGYDASFDVGLTPITSVLVSQPTFSPYSITLPGEAITASAAVSGPGPYSYQWQTDGGSGGTLTNIPGATSSQLAISTTGFASGSYRYAVLVSNGTSSTTSTPAVLTVQQPIPIPGVIAVKFGFTNGYATSDAPLPADNTGVATGQLVPPSYQPLTAVGNWNNLMANVLPPQDTAARVAAINQTWDIAHDSAGTALSGVTMTASGFNDGWFSGGTGCAAGRLLYTCWKFNGANGQVDGGGRTFAALTFNNLPASTYDVFLYINNNNGNYWGNAQANAVIGQNSDNVDNGAYGFNGANSEPCGLASPFHTAGAFGTPVNFIKLPYVATEGGTITISVVSFGGGDMGVSGVQLVPSPDLKLVQDTPNYVQTVVGEQVTLSGAFTNSPAVNLQWQKISDGATNNVTTGVVNVTNNGVVTSTLTLNRVQVSDAGSYRLKAINAANSLDYAYSSTTPLVVSNVPAAVNNVLVYGDAQASAGFVTPWTVDASANLVNGFQVGDGSPGTCVPGTGNFGLDAVNGNPAILTDGTPGNSKAAMVSCGLSGGAGQSITYTLRTDTHALGFELTNITVYGGWTDAGRRDQQYQVLYSTVSAPGVFLPLVTAQYLPADPNGSAIATRTRLVPASGAVLAHNVAAVQINWAVTPQFLNGYAGYSEIVVDGTPSTGITPNTPGLAQDITPLTADDVVGSSLTLTASFEGATSFQWQKNGTNLPGATTPTLVLSNLQLSDTATNGGYRLVASNAAGGSFTRECAVIVSPAPAASANLILAFAHQTSDAPSFAPTWDTSACASSLLFWAFPSDFGLGNFTDPDTSASSYNQAGGLPVLTDADYGTVVNGGPHPAFATCGPNAGQFVTYTLPPSSYGYDITNLVIASGWNDSGRDDQWQTISFATVDSPEVFIPLAVVTNKPNVGTVKSVTRATLKPAAGVLAANVSAIRVDFTTPPGAENGYVGISQINLFGRPSAADNQVLAATASNQNTDTPDWAIETPSLIAGQLPSSVGAGAFAGGFNNEQVTEGLAALTDGTFGPAGLGTTNFATCGASGAGQSITYTCPNGSWTLTNIVVYSGWANFDRDGQFYDIRYSTLSAPTTFIPLTSVSYNPPAGGGPSANRVQISPIHGATALATNVYAVTFDFSVQSSSLDNGYSGYAEIVLQGTNNPVVVPVTPTLRTPRMSGGNFIMTGTGGTPGASYSWLTSTNVTAPMADWTTNLTGVLDGSGAFSNSIPVNATEPARFFRLRMP